MRTMLMTPVVLLLELIRILFIMVFLVGVSSYFIGTIYQELGTDIHKYGWMTYSAILTLIFVLYRNKLQFNGWYKGDGRKKLPKIVSSILICSSIILLVLPPVLSFL